MEVITQYEIECHNNFNCNVEKVTDNILKECLLTVFINGKEFTRLECIFKDIKELLIGHLYTEGVIASSSQIKNISIDLKNYSANVELYSSNDLTKGNIENEIKILPDLEINKKSIFKISGNLLGKSEIFDMTGNVHSVALCKDGEILYFCEDIGRYNALDKAVGLGLKNNIDFGKTILFTTGRMPSGIVKKVITAGIPVLVSRSAPTDVSIELAKKYHLTLIGFARGKTFNVYVN